MRLYLVRHGKAEQGDDDAARRLTEGGRDAVRSISWVLQRAGIRVERIEHSGLVRAAETADILAGAVRGEVHRADGLAPDDDVRSIAHRLEGRTEHSLMLVGHLPFMERLAAVLLGGSADRPVLHFKTASIACLKGDGEVWELEWFLPPDLA